ncbi:MAG: trypsin-like peptidase domain-containing protein [Candidatus Gracilibacteria bacterium]
MKKQKGKLKVVVILLVIATFSAGMLAAFLGMYAFDSRVTLRMEEWLQGRVYVEDEAMVGAVQRVMPAVVSIRVVDDSIKSKKDISGGTGFVFDQSGLVLTNKHVVKRTTSTSNYQIIFSDGSEYQAVLVGQDPFDDVAVLKIVTDGFKNDFPVVKLGDSEKLQVGQKIFTVGNMLMTYDHSVTAGIVSALDRSVSAYYYDFKGLSENLAGLIQVDASVNVGNSGGPLVNLDGEVIGMVTALEEVAPGIGFAIPIDDLKQTIISVKKNGEIINPALGVRFVMLTEKEAKALDKSLSFGALLAGDKNGMEDAVMKKSNAYKVGLREGDVILEVDDSKIDLNHPLNKVIKNYNPGDSIDIRFWRDGKENTVQVVLNSTKDFEQK